MKIGIGRIFIYIIKYKLFYSSKKIFHQFKFCRWRWWTKINCAENFPVYDKPTSGMTTRWLLNQLLTSCLLCAHELVTNQLPLPKITYTPQPIEWLKFCKPIQPTCDYLSESSWLLATPPSSKKPFIHFARQSVTLARDILWGETNRSYFLFCCQGSQILPLSWLPVSMTKLKIK